MKKNSKGLFLKIMIVISFVIILMVVLNNFYKPKLNNEFVILNKNIDIKIGENLKIDYKASNSPFITWSSSDSEIVKIDDNGIINGVNYGMAIITGKAVFNNDVLYQNLVVNVYSGDKNIDLEKVLIPEGEILMGLNSEFKIPYTLVPNNAFITSIKYDVENKDIIEINNNTIISKKVGLTSVRIIVNDNYKHEIKVNVVSDKIENRLIKKIESINFDEKEINLQINEKKKLNYSINPKDAYIKNMIWKSSDESIVSIIDGEVIAKKSGNAIVTLVVNDTISSFIKVNVLISANDIKIDYYPKTLLRVGETSKIIARVLPLDATNKTITYKSGNSSVVSVSNDGIIKGISQGSSVITLSIDTGKTMSINVNVLPSHGVINGTGNLWGYHSLNEKVPVRADNNFFQKLAQSGKGTLSSNIYTYVDSGIKYTYDISHSILNVNGTKIMTRFYYSLNTDLSSLNMLVFMGGDGENNFGGLFSDIEKNKSIIKSAGVVVLISEGSKYNTKFDQYAANYTIDFVKIIFNQKDTIRKSIGGFSTGGTKVFWTADKYNFDRVIIYSSYFNWPSSTKNLKNKEIIFYIPNKDTLYNQAKSTLSDLRKLGYTNVTIVSNSNDMSSAFSNEFLVINPGSLMINAHASENVIRSNMFSYANE